ncbi:MAG: hypothetical protein LC098_12120 [Burkholderiales bacterium]|nr:hypothetical protein [Burkholderiales bacterium]
MDGNAVEVIALTPAEWLSVLQDHAKKNPAQAARIEAAVALTSLKQYWTKTLSPNLGEPFVVPTGQFAADAYNFGKTMTALGVVGTQCSVSRGLVQKNAMDFGSNRGAKRSHSKLWRALATKSRAKRRAFLYQEERNTALGLPQGLQRQNLPHLQGPARHAQRAPRHALPRIEPAHRSDGARHARAQTRRARRFCARHGRLIGHRSRRIFLQRRENDV